MMSSGLESDPNDKLLNSISGVHEALLEVTNRQVSNRAINIWINEVGEAMDDAEDLSDVLANQALREEATKDCALVVRRRYFSGSDPIAFRQRMSRKIKNVTMRLDQLAAQKPWLDLAESDGSNGRLQEDYDTSDVVQSCYKGSKLEWKFIIATLSLEILSAYLDQCSSPTRPYYALLAMIVSFVALVISMVESGLKSERGLRRNGRIYPSLIENPLEWFVEHFGLVCSMVQLVTSAVQCDYFMRHEESPLKLSLFPLLFIIYVMFSKLAPLRS